MAHPVQHAVPNLSLILHRLQRVDSSKQSFHLSVVELSRWTLNPGLVLASGGAHVAGDSVVYDSLQDGFCAVSETSGSEFSNIDLSQKVRRKPSHLVYE